MQLVLNRGWETLKRAVQWWLAGLALILPERIRQLWDAPAIKLIIQRDGSGWALFRSIGFQSDKATIARVESQRGLIIALQAQPYLLRMFAQIHLELDREEMLTFQRKVPETRVPDLMKILNYELQRSTLFHPDNIYSGVRISAPDRDNGLSDVTHFVIPRDRVGPLLGVLNAAGHHVRGLHVRGLHDRGAGAQIRLLGPGPDSERSRRKPMDYICAAVLIALVLTIAYHVNDWRAGADQRMEQLQSQVRVLRQRLRADATVRDKRRTMHASLTRARRIQRSRHPVPVVLAELSKRLPQSTWVYDFQYQVDSVVVSGFSDAAATLTNPLAASDVFAAAEFVAPIVKDPMTGQDRFRLKLSLSPLDE